MREQLTQSRLSGLLAFQKLLVYLSCLARELLQRFQVREQSVQTGVARMYRWCGLRSYGRRGGSLGSGRRLGSRLSRSCGGCRRCNPLGDGVSGRL